MTLQVIIATSSSPRNSEASSHWLKNTKIQYTLLHGLGNQNIVREQYRANCLGLEIQTQTNLVPSLIEIFSVNL